MGSVQQVSQRPIWKKLWLSAFAVLWLPSYLQAADQGDVTLLLKGGALFDESEGYVFAQDIISFGAARANPEDGFLGEIGLRYQHDADTDYGIFFYSSYMNGDENVTNIAGGLGFLPIQPVPGTTVPIAVTGILAKAERLDVRIDFERGQTRDLNSGEFRWFGGIRAEYLRNDVDIQSTLAATPLLLDRESYFLGIGPRLGGEYRTRISNNWSFGGKAAAFALFGQRRTKIRQSSTIFANVTNTTSDEFAVAYGGEAELSFSRPLNESGWVLTFGYGASILAGAIDNDPGLPIGGALFAPISIDDDDDAMITHGLFFGIAVPL